MGKLKKKEKETRELTKELKQMRADVANANLEVDKLKRQLGEATKNSGDADNRFAEIVKQQEEWKSLSDLLQTQLDEKNVEFASLEDKVSNLTEELSSTKSRMLLFKNEAEN